MTLSSKCRLQHWAFGGRLLRFEKFTKTAPLKAAQGLPRAKIGLHARFARHKYLVLTRSETNNQDAGQWAGIVEQSVGKQLLLFTRRKRGLAGRARWRSRSVRSPLQQRRLDDDDRRLAIAKHCQCQCANAAHTAYCSFATATTAAAAGPRCHERFANEPRFVAPEKPRKSANVRTTKLDGVVYVCMYVFNMLKNTS